MSMSQPDLSGDLHLMDSNENYNLYYNGKTGKYVILTIRQETPGQDEKRAKDSTHDSVSAATTIPHKNFSRPNHRASLNIDQRTHIGEAFYPPVTTKRQSRQGFRNDSVAFEPSGKVNRGVGPLQYSQPCNNRSSGFRTDQTIHADLSPKSREIEKTVRTKPSLFELVEGSRAEVVDENEAQQLARQCESTCRLRQAGSFPIPRRKSESKWRMPEADGFWTPPTIKKIAPDFSKKDLMRTCRFRNMTMNERTILADMHYLQRDLRSPGLRERVRRMKYQQLEARSNELKVYRRRSKTLFDLPREVRNMIYLYVGTADQSLVLWSQDGVSLHEHFSIPALAQTCWRLRSEFPAKEFWSENTFQFDLRKAKDSGEWTKSLCLLLWRASRFSNSPLLQVAASNIRHAVVRHGVAQTSSGSADYVLTSETTRFGMLSDGSVLIILGFDMRREDLLFLAKTSPRPMVVRQRHTLAVDERLEPRDSRFQEDTMVDEPCYETEIGQDCTSVVETLHPVLSLVINFVKLCKPVRQSGHSCHSSDSVLLALETRKALDLETC